MALAEPEDLVKLPPGDHLVKGMAWPITRLARYLDHTRSDTQHYELIWSLKRLAETIHRYNGLIQRFCRWFKRFQQ